MFCSPVSKVVGSTDTTGDQNKIRSFSFKYVLMAKSEYDLIHKGTSKDQFLDRTA